MFFKMLRMKMSLNFTLLVCALAFSNFCYASNFTLGNPVESESINTSLQIEGKIPTWLSGTYVRNGPVDVSINGKSNEHLFDGLAHLLSFSFENGKVTYSNKFLRTDAFNAVFKEGRIDYAGFAKDPCRSLFRNFLSYFFPSSDIPLYNANVNVAKLAEEYVALTEIPLPIRFDPKTLNTLGVFKYEDTLPKSSCWESAHPHYIKDQDEVINYLIEYRYQSYYTFYSIDNLSKERRIIAQIPVNNPAYMHSFALTENYIILTEFPFIVKPLNLITSGKAFIKNFLWLPELGTKFIVINRATGEVEKTLKTKPFFAFHHVNAFEKNGNIYLDLITYADPEIITSKFLNENPENSYQKNCPTKLERFYFSLRNDEISYTTLFDKTLELPRIFDVLDSKSYSYTYAVGFKNNSKELSKKNLNSNSLYKINVETKETQQWMELGCSPGEPVFIPSPNPQTEDDGVILSVALDEYNNSSFLLVLDAKSFKEIARAIMPCPIPTGLHGQYFK